MFAGKTFFVDVYIDNQRMKSSMERKIRSLGGRIARTSTRASHVVWQDGDVGVLRRAQSSASSSKFLVVPAFIADAERGVAVLGHEDDYAISLSAVASALAGKAG